MKAKAGVEPSRPTRTRSVPYKYLHEAELLLLLK